MSDSSNRAWLRPILKPLMPTLREIVSMSAFVNLLALAAPVFTLQVYDRVVGHNGIGTLYGLVIGMAVIPANAQSEEWDIAAPFGPTKDVSFTVDEGTWLQTDVSTDGMLQGPNFKAVRAMCEAVACNIIASGGDVDAADVLLPGLADGDALLLDIFE